MDRLHWQRLDDNASDSDSHYLLALSTLGDATQKGLFPFLSLRPRWPRQVSNDCRCRRHYHVAFTNVNDPLTAWVQRCTHAVEEPMYLNLLGQPYPPCRVLRNGNQIGCSLPTDF